MLLNARFTLDYDEDLACKAWRLVFVSGISSDHCDMNIFDQRTQLASIVEVVDMIHKWPGFEFWSI